MPARSTTRRTLSSSAAIACTLATQSYVLPRVLIAVHRDEHRRRRSGRSDRARPARRNPASTTTTRRRWPPRPAPPMIASGTLETKPHTRSPGSTPSSSQCRRHAHRFVMQLAGRTARGPGPLRSSATIAGSSSRRRSTVLREIQPRRRERTGRRASDRDRPPFGRPARPARPRTSQTASQNAGLVLDRESMEIAETRAAAAPLRLEEPQEGREPRPGDPIGRGLPERRHPCGVPRSASSRAARSIRAVESSPGGPAATRPCGPARSAPRGALRRRKSCFVARMLSHTLAGLAARRVISSNARPPCVDRAIARPTRRPHVISRAREQLRQMADVRHRPVVRVGIDRARHAHRAPRTRRSTRVTAAGATAGGDVRNHGRSANRTAGACIEADALAARHGWPPTNSGHARCGGGGDECAAWSSRRRSPRNRAARARSVPNLR